MNCRRMGLGEVWSDIIAKNRHKVYIYIYVCTFFPLLFPLLSFSLLNLIVQVQETKRGRTNLLDYIINTNLNTSLISYDLCTYISPNLNILLNSLVFITELFFRLAFFLNTLL